MPNYKTKTQSNMNYKQNKYGNKKRQFSNKHNSNRNDNNYYKREKLNIYEVCEMVKQYIGNICNKHDIHPSVLYEELHYQLPEEWVNNLRYIIRTSARIQVKREFDISSSESSIESDI